jgi:RimJ/RimL family protein N-acetyltransferase
MVFFNSFGQPVGAPLPDWKVPPPPSRKTLSGRFCRLEPLDAHQHTADLYAALAQDKDGRGWTYLPYGPFASESDFTQWLAAYCVTTDPLFFAIVDLASGRAAGLASYLRILPTQGSIEVGHLNFSPVLQRTPAATEAMVLMMREAFALGYRRYEWKCNALNAASRRAAQRLGLSFEGIFRQANVVKGRNRDTAWYAAIDLEWPALEEVFCRWLSAENFDARGKQRQSLSSLTLPLLAANG